MKRYLLPLLALIIGSPGIWQPAPAAAQNNGWQALGVRAGVSATGDATIHQYELFGTYLLPWGIGKEEKWRLATKANGAAGVMHGAGRTGVIVSLGPGLGLSRGGVPLELDAGVSVAFLSEDTFDGRDLNGNVQFISHLGVNFRPRMSPVGVGYDFQHMSNADLNGTGNPGVNLHMISLIWYIGR